MTTAIKTVVVLLCAWVIVFVVGFVGTITSIEPKSLIFLLLSGLATGASWLCYSDTIQNGIVSVVVPTDKLSIVVTVALDEYYIYRCISLLRFS